jgi:NTE family protein
VHLDNLPTVISRPDVLVLGGGGVIGERWMMGLLAGIEDATGSDLRQCEYFVGTSAGSIVAARLAAGVALNRPSVSSTALALATPGPPPVPAPRVSAARRAGQWALAAWSPLAPLALVAAGPPGALVRAGLMSRAPRPTATLEELGAYVARQGGRFDGRLRIVCVDRHRGRRVVFGSPGAPYATVARAVQASCSVPWLFAPVAIGGEEYVDGGVWSATNLDVAPASRDTHVLCLNPTAGISGSHSVVTAARRFARSAVLLEALALRRKGAIVETIAPDADSAAAMGVDFMDPEPRPLVLAAGYQQGLQIARGR